MKKILFAMAALAALTSCQKADLAEQNSVNTNGERVITAYFDNAGTKTTLDENGITPKWAQNDKIMLLNETSKEEITLDGEDISSDGKSVTITTTLGGTIYAVYPSNATSAERVETPNIVPVTLSAENQDGTFASANICVAKDNDGSLAFKNVTSVLHLTQTAATTKVNEIIITTGSATEYIAGTGTVDISATTPALTLSSDQSNKIKVKSASAKSDYYIAVAPTTLPAGTAFGFATGSELGGTNLSDTKIIAANTIYNIGSMDASAITYHDYVEIGDVKWATKNLGATNPQDYGRYFQWGEIAGHECSGTTSGSTFKDSYSFNWASAPFNDGSSYDENYFTTNKGTWLNSDDVLKSDYDAAYQTWGSSWHIPTKEDFADLANKGVWYWTDDYNSTGVKGYIVYVAEDKDDEGKANIKGTWKKWNGSSFSTSGASAATGSYDVTDSHMFFPAAGYGLATSLSNAGSGGYYWSSSLYSSPDSACRLNFYGSNVSPQDDKYRYHGCSVRPVSD